MSVAIVCSKVAIESESVKKFVTTHLPKQLALNINGVKAKNPLSLNSGCMYLCNKETPQEIEGYKKHRYPNSPGQGIEVQPMPMDLQAGYPKYIGEPRARPGDHNRCFRDRMGFSYGLHSPARGLRRVNEEVRQQLQGVVYNSNCTTISGENKNHNSGEHRQHNSHSCNQQDVGSQLAPGRYSTGDLEIGQQDELDTDGMSHCRPIQHHSRPTLKGETNINRMEYPQGGIQQGDSIHEQQIGSGSLCNMPQQEVANLHFPMSRQECSSPKRVENVLERVETSVHVSTDSFNFEGFSQVTTLKTTISNPDYKEVHSTQDISIHQSENDSSKNHRGSPNPSGSRQDTYGTPNFQSSRLEVIKLAHRRKNPGAEQGTIDMMSTPIKMSSENDYNSKWKDFMKFIIKNGRLFNEISEQDVLDYLNHLFENKHFLPSTVEKYRSAISRPLRFWHRIDIANDEGISDLIKAMKKLVPKNPPKRPQWVSGRQLSS